jgi:hypothetical protein
MTSSSMLAPVPAHDIFPLCTFVSFVVDELQMLEP